MLKSPRVVTVLLLISSTFAFRSAQQGQTFRGRWFLDAPTSQIVFQPCGAREKWLAVLDSSFLANAETDTTMVFVAEGDSATPDLASLLPVLPPTFVIVKGDTSSVGKYGRNGEYHRRVLVRDLDSLPSAERAKCR